MAKFIPRSFAAPLSTIVLLAAAACGPVDSSERSSQRADAIRRTECNRVGNESEVVLGQASIDEEYVLTLTARSVSRTLWEQAGNEALILEVSGPSGLIGHLVLHQGADEFAYSMHLGALGAGDAVTAKVSPLSAKLATPEACLGAATLTPGAMLGPLGEGLRRAPIFRWPVEKRFDDIPLVVGWSAGRREYVAYYSNENGGTVFDCGGGASGMYALFSRWGRGADVEGMYRYGPGESWQRCGHAPSSPTPVLRKEALHPIVYLGNNHNNLFESRGGFGRTDQCEGGPNDNVDGQFQGWNVNNPGNEMELDGPYVVIYRPAPIPMDDTDYALRSGARERVLDEQAPWMYRIIHKELERHGWIDGIHTFPMEQYFYYDLHATEVDGAGDGFCNTTPVTMGFRLTVITTDGIATTGPRMTRRYFGTSPNTKRQAIALDRIRDPEEVSKLIVTVHDGDGIFLRGLGQAFMVRPMGDNAAQIVPVIPREKPIHAYVDEFNVGCVNGEVSLEGRTYPCVGKTFEWLTE